MPRRTEALSTPHIPLGLSLAEGISILKLLGTVQAEHGPERCYKVDVSAFKVAIYETEGKVSSVWYDDPNGRSCDADKEDKVKLYLQRYGPLTNWELRWGNGWMLYWFNPNDKVAMVYGVHKDVIRFNQFDEANSQEDDTSEAPK